MPVVASGTLFHSTASPETKPAPLTASVNDGPPAGTEAGLMLAIAGAGGLTVKVAAFEVDPLGLISVTVAAPPKATRDAGTVALTCAGPANLVVRGEPFHCRTQLTAKLSPVTVRGNDAAPAIADAGEQSAMMARG